jgi:hypothetical protein
MNEIRNYLKRNKELSDDIKKAVLSNVKQHDYFIATSRKLVLGCSCGLTSQVWSNNGAIITSARGEWFGLHNSCKNNGSGPTADVILN